MVRLFVNTGGGTGYYISLGQYLEENYSVVPPVWNEYMEWVNEGMSISNDDEYQSFIKRMNLRSWDAKNVLEFYENLKRSNLAEIFDDEILKFIAHLYGIGYFNRIGNPKLEEWVNIKGVFKPNRERIPIDEKYSLMDLANYRNGLNAIKQELIFALKW